MNFKAGYVIYLYLIACVVLMIFNFGYIIYSNRKKRDTRGIKKWQSEIMLQIKRISDGEGVEPHHINDLVRRLIKPNTLIAYTQTLELIKSEHPESLNLYIHACYPAFQELAHKYKRHDSMERAFFSDFIRSFPAYSDGEHRALLDILISYLDRSTVYCRENVLRALYALGNAGSVVTALQILNDRGLFHHQKLISDGLMTFTGNKEELAAILWSNCKEWNDYLMLSVMQFIANCSPNYQEAFLPILKDKGSHLEMRLLIIRYYRRYPYEQARPVLIEYLTTRDKAEDEVVIVAAVALGRYPGNDTVRELKNALSDRNWYVRYNAAGSLVALRTPLEDLQDILEGGDKYAREILLYRLEQEGYLLKYEKVEAATV